MNKNQSSKKYDLEERTYNFAKDVRDFVKEIQQNRNNTIYITQLLRSSSSIGANLIEAVEALSKKDFYHRIKICRKEAKETKYWLSLLDSNLPTSFKTDLNALIQEANELMKIFGSIVSNK
jgi:four helix bundle protein